MKRSCRSEEHTSELQSQSNLVCRLLLEKKKGSSSDCLRAGRPRRAWRECRARPGARPALDYLRVAYVRPALGGHAHVFFFLIGGGPQEVNTLPLPGLLQF